MEDGDEACSGWGEEELAGWFLFWKGVVRWWHIPTIPKASKEELGGSEAGSGAESRGAGEMEASPYRIRTGGKAADRCCWSLLLRELSGCSTSPSTAAQMITLRARPGMACGLCKWSKPCPKVTIAEGWEYAWFALWVRKPIRRRIRQNKRGETTESPALSWEAEPVNKTF